jgi:DnaK suppressor protein
VVSAPTEAQLDEIARDLLALQAQLQILIADETGATDTVVLDQSTQGRLSRMDAMQAQKMAEAQMRRASQRLERVQSVLAIRADPDQDFGACRACEQSISFRRLKAQPDALFCVACAQEREG